MILFKHKTFSCGFSYYHPVLASQKYCFIPLYCEYSNYFRYFSSTLIVFFIFHIVFPHIILHMYEKITDAKTINLLSCVQVIKSNH